MAQPILLDDGVQLAFELVGIFAFAVSGALMAIRKDFDVVGIVLLAGITALGGGVARDVFIGAIPPVAFTNLGYFLMPVAAAAVAFFAHPAFERLTTAVLVFDAAGLGFFCVGGTLKALEYGLRPLPAAALGVVTGVGGGLLRDVIAREVPALVRPDTPSCRPCPPYRGAGGGRLVGARSPGALDRRRGGGVHLRLPCPGHGPALARPPRLAAPPRRLTAAPRLGRVSQSAVDADGVQASSGKAEEESDTVVPARPAR